MSVLSEIDFKMDETEKALIMLHSDFKEVMRLVYSEFEEDGKGYAMVPKRKILNMLSRGKYTYFLHLLRKVFRIEHTRRYLIVFPQKKTI